LLLLPEIWLASLGKDLSDRPLLATLDFVIEIEEATSKPLRDGFAGPPLDVSFAALNTRAREIEARFRLPARTWIAGIRAENGFSERLQV